MVRRYKLNLKWNVEIGLKIILISECEIVVAVPVLVLVPSEYSMSFTFHIHKSSIRFYSKCPGGKYLGRICKRAACPAISPRADCSVKCTTATQLRQHSWMQRGISQVDESRSCGEVFFGSYKVIITISKPIIQLNQKIFPFTSCIYILFSKGFSKTTASKQSRAFQSSL